MKFLDKYNNSIKIAFLTMAISIVVFILMIPCFFFHLKDVPLGVIFGGAVISLTYLLTGLAEKKDEERGTLRLTIVMVAAKFIITAAILVVICFMYFKWGLPIFNPFAYIGVYTLALLINVIVHIKERKTSK